MACAILLLVCLSLIIAVLFESHFPKVENCDLKLMVSILAHPQVTMYELFWCVVLSLYVYTKPAIANKFFILHNIVYPAAAIPVAYLFGLFFSQ